MGPPSRARGQPGACQIGGDISREEVSEPKPIPGAVGKARAVNKGAGTSEHCPWVVPGAIGSSAAPVLSIAGVCSGSFTPPAPRYLSWSPRRPPRSPPRLSDASRAPSAREQRLSTGRPLLPRPRSPKPATPQEGERKRHTSKENKRKNKRKYPYHIEPSGSERRSATTLRVFSLSLGGATDA